MESINSVAKQASSWATGTKSEKDFDQFKELTIQLSELRIRYTQQKTSLPESAQALFEKLQHAAQTAKATGRVVANMAGSNQAGNDESIKLFSQIISTMKTILNFSGDKERIADIEELKVKMDPILARYSPDLQKEIRRTVIQIKRASQLQQGSKTVLYLVGKRGTGKTTFTEALAKALELPLIEITDIEKALEAKERLFQYGDQINPSFKLSAFTQDLSTQPKNAILFLDELDKILNKPQNTFGQSTLNLEQFLLQLLDPNKKTIKLPDLDLEIDVSGLTIIAAGNAQLESGPLVNRMKELVFPCIEKEKRPGIAKKRFENLMAVREDLQYSPEDEAMLGQIAAEDPYCGVRSLEFVVNDYVLWKEEQQAKWGMDANFNITKAFESHPDK